MVHVEPVSEIRPKLLGDFEFHGFVPRTNAIEEAYHWGKELHSGQKRLSGEPYFETHCVWVAALVDYLTQNEAWTIGALLHDCVEDQNESLEKIKDKFPGTLGIEVSTIVDGVTKLVMSRGGHSREIETLRKIAMFRDVGVFLVKLADKTHNLVTLQHMPRSKQKKKAVEAIRAYGKLAGVLNCYKWRRWLEDMAFPFAEPETFKLVKEKIDNDPRLQLPFINSMMRQLGDIMGREGINGRVEIIANGYWQAWQKLRRMARMRLASLDSFTPVNDIISFRLIVQSDNPKDCYLLLGGVNRFLGPQLDQNRFDDYIAYPQNGYRALQATAWLPGYGAIEVAIATDDMEGENQWGVVHVLQRGRETHKYNPVTVITPTGGLRFVPENSTVLDAVAAIQQDFLLDKMSTITVNGNLANLADKVAPGDVLEVITGGARLQPGEEWLTFCNSSTARLLRIVLATQRLRKTAEKGRTQIIQILSERGVLDLEDVLVLQSDRVFTLLEQVACANLEDLYAAVGGGAVSLEEVSEALDEALISQEQLGWTTIRMVGSEQSNRPGVLAELIGLVSHEKGNIARLVNNTLPDGGFSIRFVVQGLKAEGKLHIMKMYQQCGITLKSLDIV